MGAKKEQLELAHNPRALQHYVLKGRLDLSQIQELDTTVPLRVLAVRDNRVLRSEIIELHTRKEFGAIDFDLEFHLPGRRRCGVHLIVSRGDIGEAKPIGIEGVKRWISANQWHTRETGHNPFVVDVGSIVIPDQIYKHWLLCCRRYTIRGRVVCRHWFYDPIEQQWVFVDEPVPGATVEVYDTDCWWWWCFRDLIDTGVTDVNGNFEISFVWCCRSWFPFRRPWVIDPDLLERIRNLLTRIKLPIPLPDPPPDPIRFQEFVKRLAGIAAAPAQMVMARQTAGLPAPAAEPPASALALKAVLPPAPELEALHVWPWWPWRDCAPDVTFRVTQPCGGDVRVIYSEGRSQTRWNIPQTLDVTLEANDEACCLPEPPDPPCGDCLAFTWVHCVRMDQISTDAGPPDLRGYHVSPGPGVLDRPFGGPLRIRGAFGEDAQPVVDFYRIEYRRDGMLPGTWIDMGSVAGLLGPVSRAYWTGAPAFSPSIPFGPMSVDGRTVYMTRHKYERDNPAPGFGWLWDDWDTLFWWNTESLPEGDGLYTFRLVAYRQAADGTLVDERVMPLCGTEDDDVPTDATVMVRVDNRNVPHAPSVPAHPCGGGTVHLCTAEPDCDFVSVVKNEGVAGEATVNPCDIVTIADTDTVTIHFSVTVPATVTDGHLLAYEMTLHYGESGLASIITPGPPSAILAGATLDGDPTPHKGPTYDEALMQGPPGSIARPFWYGGNFKVTLPGSAFPVSCAYLLRLRAWKRTTNGCTDPYYFHANFAEFSFCVIKPSN